MKKLFIIIALLSASLSLMAQDGSEALQARYQQFAFELFNKVAEEGNQNIIISPLSAQLALSMLMNGAAGSTLSEMREMLGITDFDTDLVNTYNQSLTTQLTYRPPFEWDPQQGSEEQCREQYDFNYPTCEIANGLWTAPDIILKEDFTSKLHDHYGAEPANVDFGTQEGIDEINTWVSDHTHQLVPSVLDRPDPKICMVMANTLYFKGSWSTSFPLEKTRVEKFHLADGMTIDVDMMEQQGSFKTTTTERFATLTLPYGKNEYSMTFFLPVGEQAFPPLTYEDWSAAMNVEQKSRRILKLPRFSIEGEYDLIPVLRKMGMVSALGMTPDFSNMTDAYMWISDLFQCGKIIVDERGTEAGAVTVIVGSRMSPKETFIVDRPFYFTIENQATHTILFAGRMATVPATTETPNAIGDTPEAPAAACQRLYDLSGRPLPQVPQRGVYIQDGKKHVVR